MGSGPTAQQAPDVGTSTNAQLQAYINNLPQLLNTTAGQTLPVGQTNQTAQNVLAPEAQQLENQLLATFGPGLYQTGNTLSGINSAGGIANASNNLSGQGGTLINQAVSADKQANPEYYAARAQAGGQLSNLLSSINLGGLTGSESAQVERANAQSDSNRGLLTSPSQTATVSNAMNFGTALQNKQNLLANAISTATSFLPSSKSGVDAFGIGSGMTTNQSNPGATQFGTGANQATAASSTNTALGGNLLGGVNSTANNSAAINAGFPSGLDKNKEITDIANGILNTGSNVYSSATGGM